MKKVIIIPSKKRGKNKKTSKNRLEDHIQVYPKNLKYLYGSWIKSINNITNEYLSGGFLSNIDLDRCVVSLRHPKLLDLQELDTNIHSFYVSKDNSNYLALQEIELEKDFIKNKIEYINKELKIIEEKKKEFQLFEANKKKFELQRAKFYKMFSEGKIKILD